MEEKKVARITHFFDKIGVAVMKIEDSSISVGETIHIKGSTTDFEQEISSMQIDHSEVEQADPGQSVGIKLDKKAREQDLVYKILDDL